MFSDYIIYADESGDHSLSNVDETHPVFVLAFCLFQKSEYVSIAAPMISHLKFNFWGHDIIILHSHKIRKQREEFSILNNKEKFNYFVESLSTLVAEIPFSIIATVIDKRKLKLKYSAPSNPYHLGLQYCLERATKFLKEQKQNTKITYIVVEARGKKEDEELELEFRRLIQKDRGLATFEIVFADKKVNSPGLQIADLVAHPIGRHVIDPAQENRVYSIVEKKFHSFPNHAGRGLKIFPDSLKRKTPVYTKV